MLDASGKIYDYYTYDDASKTPATSFNLTTYAPSGVGYDPATGVLTVTGSNLTTNTADYVLSDFTITGEGAGSYILGNGDVATAVTATHLTIQIAAANQTAVDALLDAKGVNPLVSSSNYFNLSVSSGWDSGGGLPAPAYSMNTVLVASTGTPSLTHANTFAAVAGTTSGGSVVIENGLVTATGAPDLSSTGTWAGGNLTASLAATNRDTSNDALLIGAVGGITTSGSSAGATVSYNGNVIGTIKTGATGSANTDLTVTFSGAYVTDAAVAALSNAIQFTDTNITGTTGARTVNFTLTDAYGRASNTLADTLTVVTSPTIAGARYNPFTGVLTIQGAGFSGSVTLGNLSLAGESGAGTFNLSAINSSVSSITSTAVTIQIGAAYQQALNAVLDKSGLTAQGGATFNLNAASNWNTSAPADATNPVAVSSTGTVTFSHSGTSAATDTNFQSSAVTVDNGTITVGDINYFIVGAWQYGTLNATVSGTAYDSIHDQLSIAATGGITVSGSTVSYNGNQIGTVTGGSASGAPGQTLTIALSGQYATNAAVQALVGAIKFSDSATTNSIGTRTVAFTLTDAYGRSASLADTVGVTSVPQISGAAYDPATGLLVLTGTGLATNAANYTLSNMSVTGEGSGAYTQGNGDAISGTPTTTSVTIQIAAANRAALDAILDRNGTTALANGSTFNLSATAGWDANGSVSAFADTTNTVTVTSSGTPTISNSAHVIPSATTVAGAAKTVDSSTITVADSANPIGADMWGGGNLTISVGATNKDASHDKLGVGNVGLITVSGSTVSYNGTAIGTIQAGATGVPGQNLTIKLANSGVTDSIVAALVNVIQFSDTAATTAGTRSFSYVLTDAYGRSSAPLSDIMYVTYDTPPTFLVANSGTTLITGKNMALSLSSYLGVSDIDANQIETWSVSGAAGHGTVSFGRTTAASGSSSISAPTITYTPTTDYVGTDSFTIQVSDGAGGIVTKTFTVNVIVPTISSITRAAGASTLTNGDTVSFTVTLNEAVSGLTAGNFTLGGVGTVTGTIGTPTTSDGGQTWTVPVSGLTGDGTLGLNLVNTLISVVDSFSQSPSAGFTDTASLFTVDHTAPVISGVTLNATAYKINDSAIVTITTDAYDGNGTYTLSASTVDGASLGSWTYTAGSSSGTATFTVTGSLTDVLSGSVPVNIRVTDAAGNTSSAYSAGVAGAIIDTHTPTAMAISNILIPLAANSVAGTLSTTDASIGAESFTYAITGGADAAKFQILNGNQLAVANRVTLNAAGSYSVIVRVTDAGGNAFSRSFALTGASGPIATAGGSLTYNERSSAAVIDNTVTLTNATGAANMTGATVIISSGYVAGDVLGFTSQNGITGTQVGNTLTLAGAASFSDYQMALRSVTFAAPALFETATASRAVTWTATDSLGTGVGATSSVTVAYVNAPPLLTATGATADYNTVTAASGGTLLFTGVTPTARESGQNLTGITLAVTGLADGSSEQMRIGGTWVSLTSGASGTVGGITYAVGTVTNGSTIITLTKTDSVANWASLLGALSYKDVAAASAMSAGIRTFAISSMTDAGGAGNGGRDTSTFMNPVKASLSLTANTIPTVTVPAAQVISSTGANAITGLSVMDSVVGGSVSATVTAAHGTLGFAGAGITGNNSASVTISATSVSALNIILGTLTYTTGLTSPGADTIAVTVNDMGSAYVGGAKSGTGIIGISVTNATPVVTAPSTITDTLSGWYNVGGVSVAEPLASSAVSATVASGHGILDVTAAGASVTGNDSVSVTITGTLTQVNAALSSLKYQTSLTDSGTDALVDVCIRLLRIRSNGKWVPARLGGVLGRDRRCL